MINMAGEYEVSQKMPWKIRKMYLFSGILTYNIKNTSNIAKVLGEHQADEIIEFIIKYGESPNWLKTALKLHDKAYNIIESFNNNFGNRSLYGFVYRKFSRLMPNKNGLKAYR